jgi:anti-sigma-K factor RskA
MTLPPDFDELVGRDVPPEERARLYRAHQLLIQAGPPPELSPDLDTVPWPDEALTPLWGRPKKTGFRRPLVLAAALASALVVGLVLGQATSSSKSSINAWQTIRLGGTQLASNASGTLELARRDSQGNYEMVLRVKGLPRLAGSGYYTLDLTKDGKAVVPCGTFNVNGETVVRMNAAYDLAHFDKNGWVVTRETPGHFQHDQIVLKPA